MAVRNYQESESQKAKIQKKEEICESELLMESVLEEAAEGLKSQSKRGFVGSRKENNFKKKQNKTQIIRAYYIRFGTNNLKMQMKWIIFQEKYLTKVIPVEKEN